MQIGCIAEQDRSTLSYSIPKSNFNWYPSAKMQISCLTDNKQRKYLFSKRNRSKISPKVLGFKLSALTPSLCYIMVDPVAQTWLEHLFSFSHLHISYSHFYCACPTWNTQYTQSISKPSAYPAGLGSVLAPVDVVMKVRRHTRHLQISPYSLGINYVYY